MERGDVATGETLIEVQNLSRTFGMGSAQVKAVDRIDLTLKTGEFVAIRGASGSGKSTLLQILGLLDDFDGGSYHFDGRPVSDLTEREVTRIRNEQIGFVFQSFHLLADRNAVENVSLPLLYRRKDAEKPHDPVQMLERVGLGERLKHRPGELSGGECQRVAIARALVKRPRLILFDEPTGNLDSKTGGAILDLLDEVHQQEKATLLVVTHNDRVAERAGRVLDMRDGRWVDSR